MQNLYLKLLQNFSLFFWLSFEFFQVAGRVSVQLLGDGMSKMIFGRICRQIFFQHFYLKNDLRQWKLSFQYVVFHKNSHFAKLTARKRAKIILAFIVFHVLFEIVQLYDGQDAQSCLIANLRLNIELLIKNCLLFCTFTNTHWSPFQTDHSIVQFWEFLGIPPKPCYW